MYERKERKYVFTGKKLRIDDLNRGPVELSQIRSVRDIGKEFPAGTVGGWIEGRMNLSEEGNCLVGGNAAVLGSAKVSGNAVIMGDAVVASSAIVTDSAVVSGNCVVEGHAILSGNCRVTGECIVRGNAKVFEDAVINSHVIVQGNAVVHGDVKVGGYSVLALSADVCKLEHLLTIGRGGENGQDLTFFRLDNNGVGYASRDGESGAFPIITFRQIKEMTYMIFLPSR